MRRAPGRPGWALALAGALLAAIAAPPVRAQDSTKVRLELSLAEDSSESGARQPIVRTRHLLQDPRWVAMLGSGFPLRLHYRTELWRSREGWFDSFGQQVEWDVVVQHEPLLDQYTVTRLTGRSRRENRYATLDALGASLGSTYRVALTPGEAGEYYYVASLQITLLSDSDLEELERFLRRDLKTNGDGEENFGSAVGRGAKRLVLKLAGLPSLSLEDRSARFEVRSER
ncbi:MAG: DUF4390 domain-containing protein [Gemmatimonadales bacterium]